MELTPEMEPDEQKLRSLEQKFPHKVSEQFVFKGKIYNRFTSPYVVGEGTANFEVRADDVVVAGYMKSGTTWLSMIANLVLSRGEYITDNDFLLKGASMQFKQYFDVLPEMPSPRLYRTHMHYPDLPVQTTSKRPRIIQVMRQPKDMVVSLFHFYRSSGALGRFAGSWQEFLEMFLGGYVLYGSWFDYVRTWWPHRQDDNVLLLFYEDAKRDHRGTIEKVASFLHVELDSKMVDAIQSQTTFESMKSNPVCNHDHSGTLDRDISEFIRKGVVDDWKNYFTVAQEEYFNKMYSEKLADVEGLPWSVSSNSKVTFCKETGRSKWSAMKWV